jgi:Ca2+-binding RTX toxin-like protein
MPNFTVTGTSAIAQTLAAGELGLITEAGTLMTSVTTVTLGNATLLNNGFLGSTSNAILSNDFNAVITNFGEIVSTGGSGDAISNSGFAGASATIFLTNYGSITAGGSGNHALELVTGGLRFVNTGTISSMSGATLALSDQNAGTTGYRIVNSGSIVAGPIVVYAIDIINDDGDTISNQGYIFGDIGTSAGADIVRNSGRIDGQVALGSDNDIFFGRGGAVDEGVAGGTGDDLFYIDGDGTEIFENAASGNDTVRSGGDYTMADGIEDLILVGGTRGTGNDLSNTINGNATANLLDGAAGNDTINALGGDDTVVGGAGNDSILGDTGADRLSGGTGADSLNGGDGGDWLAGEEGADRILGFAGSDTLIGGAAGDQLYGGVNAADTFIYLTTQDSFGAVNTTRDRIMDFESGLDVIDLSAIDANVASAPDNAFARVGAFTGVAGQLIFRVVGANGFVEGDVNGDGTADFSIQLVGVTAILATDLIL